MSSDLRIKHDEGLRRRAADLFARGYGYRSAATALALPPGTVRQWSCTYESLGLEGLLVMGSSHSRYTFEQKVAAANAVVDEGMRIADAMAEFGIASRSAIQKWCRDYREGGEDALRPKPKGRRKGSVAPPKELTREQELEIQVRKLRAENAYLKKLEALRVEEELRTGSRPRW